MNKLDKHLWQVVSTSIAADQRFKFFTVINNHFPKLGGSTENTIFVYMLKNKVISLDKLQNELTFGAQNNAITNVLVQYFSFCLLQSRAFKYVWKGKLENLIARTIASECFIKKQLGLKEWITHFTKSQECYVLHTSGDGFIITTTGIYSFFWDFEKSKFKEPPKGIDNSMVKH